MVAMNFPDAPTAGDRFLGYSWDGEKWAAVPGAGAGGGGGTGSAVDTSYAPGGNIVATNVQQAIQELDNEKLALAGGTMTGGLAMDYANPTRSMIKDAAPAIAQEYIHADALPLFLLRYADTDNNFRILAHDGAAFTKAALKIDKATALAEVFGPPTTSLGIATKSYVDSTAGVGIYTPEQFGAVGNGTTDDKAAFIAAFDAIDANNGGELWMRPNKNYRHVAPAAGSSIREFGSYHYLHINGRGSTITYEGSYADNTGSWAYILDTIDDIVVENLTTVAQLGHGTNGGPRGIQHFLARFGCPRSIWRNIKMTGGQVGIGISADGSVPGLSDRLNGQAIIENVECVGTFYGVSLQGGNHNIVHNLVTYDAGRSLFVTDQDGLQASVYNYGHSHSSDVILAANASDAGTPPGNKLSDVRLFYWCHPIAGTGFTGDGNNGSGVTLSFNGTATPTPGIISNVDICFDVDATINGGLSVGGLFDFNKLAASVPDPIARSHVVDGVRISGRGVGMVNGTGVKFDNNMKVGDQFRRVHIGPLYMRGVTGADAVIIVDGTAFTTPLVLEDVDIDGAITLTNFAADMVEYRGAIRSSNIIKAAGREILGEVAGVNTQTASYTLVLADKGKSIEMNVAGANTLTIPPNASVAFPIGSYINFSQVGAGQITLTPGAGVTLRSRSGLKSGGQYAVGTLYKRGTDEWIVGGDCTA